MYSIQITDYCGIKFYYLQGTRYLLDSFMHENCPIFKTLLIVCQNFSSGSVLNLRTDSLTDRVEI